MLQDPSEGYLRVCGKVEKVSDEIVRGKVVKTAGYCLDHHGKGGVANPDLYFARIIPERAEYMRPGEDAAKDITEELPR